MWAAIESIVSNLVMVESMSKQISFTPESIFPPETEQCGLSVITVHRPFSRASMSALRIASNLSVFG